MRGRTQSWWRLSPGHTALVPLGPNMYYILLHGCLCRVQCSHLSLTNLYNACLLGKFTGAGGNQCRCQLAGERVWVHTQLYCVDFHLQRGRLQPHGEDVKSRFIPNKAPPPVISKYWWINEWSVNYWFFVSTLYNLSRRAPPGLGDKWWQRGIFWHSSCQKTREISAYRSAKNLKLNICGGQNS